MKERFDFTVWRRNRPIQVILYAQRVYFEGGLPQWGVCSIAAFNPYRGRTELTRAEAANVLGRLP